MANPDAAAHSPYAYTHTHTSHFPFSFLSPLCLLSVFHCVSHFFLVYVRSERERRQSVLVAGGYSMIGSSDKWGSWTLISPLRTNWETQNSKTHSCYSITGEQLCQNMRNWVCILGSLPFVVDELWIQPLRLFPAIKNSLLPTFYDLFYLFMCMAGKGTDSHTMLHLYTTLHCSPQSVAYISVSCVIYFKHFFPVSFSPEGNMVKMCRELWLQ